MHLFKSILQITNANPINNSLQYVIKEFKANQNEITRLQKEQTETGFFGENFLKELVAGIKSIYLPISIIVLFAMNAIANVIGITGIIFVA